MKTICNLLVCFLVLLIGGCSGSSAGRIDTESASQEKENTWAENIREACGKWGLTPDPVAPLGFEDLWSFVASIPKEERPSEASGLVAMLQGTEFAGFLSKPNYVHTSDALTADAVSPRYPRVVLFDPEGTMILSLTAQPGSEHNKMIEAFELDFDASGGVPRWQTFVGHLDGENRLEKDPAVCRGCHATGGHGAPLRPVFEGYDYWHQTFSETNRYQDAFRDGSLVLTSPYALLKDTAVNYQNPSGDIDSLPVGLQYDGPSALSVFINALFVRQMVANVTATERYKESERYRRATIAAVLGCEDLDTHLAQDKRGHETLTDADAAAGVSESSLASYLNDTQQVMEARHAETTRVALASVDRNQALVDEYENLLEADSENTEIALKLNLAKNALFGATEAYKVAHEETNHLRYFPYQPLFDLYRIAGLRYLYERGKPGRGDGIDFRYFTPDFSGRKGDIGYGYGFSSSGGPSSGAELMMCLLVPGAMANHSEDRWLEVASEWMPFMKAEVNHPVAYSDLCDELREMPRSSPVGVRASRNPID